MKRTNLFWLALICYLLMSFSLFAQFAGGSGTEQDPYQVATAEHLNNVRDYSSAWFIQTADIDLGVAPWNQGEGWVPIGTNINLSFSGHYDGADHLISNLNINRPTSSYQGLFGYSSGTILNLGLQGTSVRGWGYLGGLAGFSSGVISKCSSSGTITGDSYHTGGLVGNNAGLLNNCYSNVTVNGRYSTGGLAGSNTAVITNCYSIGSVNGLSDTGGFVGSNNGNISYSYWNTQSSGLISSAGGEGRTTAEMTWPHAANTYVDWDWRVWKPDVGVNINGGYPYFRPVGEAASHIPEAAVNPLPQNYGLLTPINTALNWQAGFSQTNTDSPSGFRLWLGTNNPPDNILDGIDIGYVNIYNLSPDMMPGQTYFWQIAPYNSIGEANNCPVWTFSTLGFAGGAGTDTDPWQVATAYQLYNVRVYAGNSNNNKYFLQTEDIDLGVPPWNQGDGWAPIEDFHGHYDGDGHVIGNLLITGPMWYKGLFSFMYGSIENLSLENQYLTGGERYGGLVGQNQGFISNCKSTGVLYGYYMQGGLVGENNGIINNCSSEVTVSAGFAGAGGLVGYNLGTINNSFSIGAVSGGGQIGGLVGLNQGFISNCYSTGSVSGSYSTGGLVGYSPSGTVSNCYWDIQSSGQIQSDGGEGRTTTEMTWPFTTNTYVGWDFDAIWLAVPSLSTDAGYPYLKRQISQIPAPAIEPAPYSTAIGVQTNAELYWEADFESYGPNPPAGYKLFFGTDNPPSNILNAVDLGATLSYTPSETLANLTTYYWQIVPYNQIGDAVNCPVWSFTTEAQQPPYAVVSAAQLSFSNIWINHSVTKSFTISNLGIQDLEVNILLGSGPFSISASNGRTLLTQNGNLLRNEVTLTIASMTTDTLYVHFQPTAVQSYTRNLFIETNAPNLPTATISLSGTGYDLFAEFVASPDQGDVPLVVAFTNQSVTGITWSLWDFGDGITSDEMNPTHIFTQKGVYNVLLTVGDENYSTSITHPVTVIAHPILEYNEDVSGNFGLVYLGDISSLATLTLYSTGTDTLWVDNVSWQNNSPGFNHSYSDILTPILPGDFLAIDIWFQPTVQGVFSDSLIIVTNAENLPVLKIRVSGRGEYVPPAAVEGLVVSVIGNDAHLTWQPVTTTIYGTPIEPDGYIVLYNETPYEDEHFYYFHSFVSGTSFVHPFVAQYRTEMFYRIVAVKNYREEAIAYLRSLNGSRDRFTWAEIKEKLNTLKQHQ